jgi:hypothetical protein
MGRGQIVRSLRAVGLNASEGSVAAWASKARNDKLGDGPVQPSTLTDEQLRPLFDAVGFGARPAGKPKLKKRA